jgi:hypothetical protein
VMTSCLSCLMTPPQYSHNVPSLSGTSQNVVLVDASCSECGTSRWSPASEARSRNVCGFSFGLAASTFCNFRCWRSGPKRNRRSSAPPSTWEEEGPTLAPRKMDTRRRSVRKSAYSGVQGWTLAFDGRNHSAHLSFQAFELRSHANLEKVCGR